MVCVNPKERRNGLMQIILTKDVDSLGGSGELHTVADGFARNYLFPQGLAVEATTGAIKDRDMRLDRIRAKADKKHQADLAKAASVEAIGTLVLSARAGEHGKLYGAVTTKELAMLVATKAGMDIDRKVLKLNHPINRLGDYELSIRFSPKVSITLAIHVVADEESDVEPSFEDADLDIEFASS
jgi:large subunit ribosomal protein L9